MLLSSLQDLILYDQVSRVPLRRGLYLGYLKLQSSVDLLQVLVPEKQPNMFPHAKIRDNPHVSRYVWVGRRVGCACLCVCGLFGM